MQQDEKNIKLRAEGLVSEGSRSSGQIMFCAKQTTVEKNKQKTSCESKKIVLLLFLPGLPNILWDKRKGRVR